MELKNIFYVLGVAILLVLILSLISSTTNDTKISSGSFSLQSIDRVGNIAYAIFSYNGSGNVTLITYDVKPSKDIFILNDNGIGMARMSEFANSIKSLSSYGYNIKTVDSLTKINSGIYVVATGAMPFYVFNSLEDTEATIVYIGKKDLFLQAGIKNREWYNELNEKQKSKIVFYENTLDQFLENASIGDFLSSIIENSWNAKNKVVRYYSSKENPRTTSSIPTENSSYVRVIYNFGNATGFMDSANLSTSQIATKHFDVFPDERFEFLISLNRSRGTVYLVIEKDGKEIMRKKQSRVLSDSVIFEAFSFKESGDYIIKVVDSIGILGGTTAHVKDVKVELKDTRARTFLFFVTVDNAPIKNGIIKVALNNGSIYQDFIVNDGLVSINARLDKNDNVFNFLLFGSKYEVKVIDSYEDVGEVYLKYGIPGLLLIVLVYVFAKLSRKPVYILRIGNIAKEVRKELKINPQQVIDVFKTTRKELHIHGPITAQEFGVSLKRHITEGADITEGNIEEILRQLTKSNVVEHHLSYYQLKDEGDVRKNVMRRMINDKLISSGISFKFSNDKFITTSYEIAFYWNNFSKKTIVMFENQTELDNWFTHLNEKDKATVKIQQFNGLVNLVIIDKIDEFL